jgi:hypothetical protein
VLATVRDTGEADVTVVVYPSIKLFADKFLLESQPANAVAVGAVVTDVTSVPPFAMASVPVKLNVAPYPLVVSPVEPPDIVTTPEDGVALPEFPFIVVIAPVAVMAVHEGLAAAPPVVKTFPEVPGARTVHTVALR